MVQRWSNSPERLLFVCLQRDSFLPIIKIWWGKKEWKRKRKKRLRLNCTLQNRMKDFFLKKKFFFNWVLFQASHSPKTFFFFLNISLAGRWILISLPCGCPKNIWNRCYDALKYFSPGYMSLVLHGCGWRRSCFKTISVHKKPSKEG